MVGRVPSYGVTAAFVIVLVMAYFTTAWLLIAWLLTALGSDFDRGYNSAKVDRDQL